MSEPFSQLLDAVDWKSIEGEKPKGLHATHEGYVQIGEVCLHVFVLSDGQRVFDADDPFIREMFNGLRKAVEGTN